MAEDTNKCGKMTVFRTDRHEDYAAMVFVTCVVAAVLLYMAYIVPTITLKAPSDGKILSVAVQALVMQGAGVRPAPVHRSRPSPIFLPGVQIRALDFRAG